MGNQIGIEIEKCGGEYVATATRPAGVASAVAGEGYPPLRVLASGTGDSPGDALAMLATVLDRGIAVADCYDAVVFCTDTHPDQTCNDATAIQDAIRGRIGADVPVRGRRALTDAQAVAVDVLAGVYGVPETTVAKAFGIGRTTVRHMIGRTGRTTYRRA
jgi:hypothetical protein